jgi:hypothetical protein
VASLGAGMPVVKEAVLSGCGRCGLAPCRRCHGSGLVQDQMGLGGPEFLSMVAGEGGGDPGRWPRAAVLRRITPGCLGKGCGG